MSLTRREILSAALVASIASACRSRALAQMDDASARPKLALLILGGTKFVGPHIVEAARARGHTVTLFNRGKTAPELFPGVEKLRGDRDGDLRALEHGRWDAVIDTSGHVPRMVRASCELLRERVGYYVFVSSLNAIADLSKDGTDESAPKSKLRDPKSEDFRGEDYGGLKAGCEDVVAAVMQAKGASVRPGLIVGPLDGSDRFTYWPVRVQRGGEVLAPGKPEDQVQVIDVRDLAEFLVHLCETRAPGLFNAVGPERHLGIGEVLETSKRVSASDARFTWVDARFLVEHGVQPWRDMPAWLPAFEPGTGLGRIDCTRAIQAGLVFRPLADTLRATLAWWNALPEERRKLRTGLSAEREREVLAAWHARQW